MKKIKSKDDTKKLYEDFGVAESAKNVGHRCFLSMSDGLFFFQANAAMNEHG